MINNLPIIKTSRNLYSASIGVRFDGPLCGWSLNRENTRIGDHELLDPMSFFQPDTCDHLLAGVVP